MVILSLLLKVSYALQREKIICGVISKFAYVVVFFLKNTFFVKNDSIRINFIQLLIWVFSSLIFNPFWFSIQVIRKWFHCILQFIFRTTRATENLFLSICLSQKCVLTSLHFNGWTIEDFFVHFLFKSILSQILI